ncbi:MAG: hypothetical protein WBQ08_00915 [Candidatus Sulfotelmatobacter sp.]
MKNNVRIRVFKAALFGAALAVFALPLVAQSNGSSAPVSGESIPDRKENQQDRIANGVKTGELTAGETTNLEKKESGLNQEEHDMRKLDDGHLTSADKTTLNQQQNKLSNQIYDDKQNSAVQNTDPKSEVGKRAENQQDRIAQGVKSGQLTAGETAHLEGGEAKINKEVSNDRAANGGKLTGQEKRQVNRQQNRESRQIYHDKHNGRRQ